MRISHFLFQLNFYKQFLTGKTLHRDTINVLRNNSEKNNLGNGIKLPGFHVSALFCSEKREKIEN